MNKEKKIFVAGSKGLVGSALVRALKRAGYVNMVTPGHDELDLCDQNSTREFFRREKPEYVFLAAARVGGIGANSTYPAQFIYENLMIQSNAIDSAWRNGCKKLCFLGSSCIYPKMAPQPISESSLLSGYLEPTNEPYAIAKISGIRMAQAYRKQYGFDAISVMPCNLYGPGDNFHNKNSHIIPALIRRFHEASEKGLDTVTIWGSGTPMREFLHVDDMADACIFLMNNYSDYEHVNAGSGEELSIMELAKLIAKVTGFKGEILNDVSKPDGTPRKIMDSSKLNCMGWRPSIGLEDGLKSTYEWYKENFSNARQ